MRNHITTLLFSILFSINLTSQNHLNLDHLLVDIDEKEKINLTKSLNNLFDDIQNESLDSSLFIGDNISIDFSVFSSLKNQEKENKKDSVEVYKKRIINCYSVNKNNDLMITISYVKSEKIEEATIKLLFSFIAIKKSDNYLFTLPLSHLTKHWKSKKIGNTNYIFRDKIDSERALIFNQKNSEIAHKMKQTPESFTFYMCKNYQELNRLLGFDYELTQNGKSDYGYGVDSGLIFSISNNEDFSHDIFHYYSGKIHKRSDRNWIAEEGIAYMWGNAYYTDSKGEMIEQERLVEELKIYLKNNPEVTPFELFSKNPKIYNHISNKIKVRSVISGIICTEIENKKGIDGIYKIITCKRQKPLKNFMSAAEEQIGVNVENFNERIMLLID